MSADDVHVQMPSFLVGGSVHMVPERNIAEQESRK